MSRSLLMRIAMSKMSSVVVPEDSARTSAFCMTGPSAMGSENGIPSSIRSAPAAAMARTSFSVVSMSGSPQVTKGMNALRENTLFMTASESIMDVPPSVSGDGRDVLVPAA